MRKNLGVRKMRPRARRLQASSPSGSSRLRLLGSIDKHDCEFRVFGGSFPGLQGMMSMVTDGGRPRETCRPAENMASAPFGYAVVEQ
jgi:hypothetical protein